STLLDPTGFSTSPLAGSTSAALIAGSGATLLPDAQATGTGTVGSLTGGTLVTGGGLNLTAGTIITVTSTSGTSTYTVTALDTVSTMLTALSGGTANVTASLVGGKIQLQSNNFLDTVSIADNNSNTDITAMGFATGNRSFTPTNLLTQSAVSQG